MGFYTTAYFQIAVLRHSSNRQKARAARGKSFWCPCDLAKVWAGQRCPACGRVSGKKRERPRK